MDGLAQVQARISAIQAQISSVSSPTTSTAAAWSAEAARAGLTGAAPTANATAASAKASAIAATGTPTSGDATGVIAKAREYLGVPYLWGGTDPSKGLDCSGFTQLVYKSLGVDLPRVSSQQATAGRAVASLDQAQPGDLLFFDYSPNRPGIDHVGIYAGDGQMIAAPQPGEVVKMQSAGQPTAIRRVLPEGSA